MPLHSLLALGLAATTPAPAPTMPDTDIHLYELRHEAGALVLGRGRNLTPTPGYDNQPSFSPDGKTLLFTAQRDGKQTDIYRYELASGLSTALTRTPESEYSPRYDADAQHFSVVRVETDGTQRLWRFQADGSAPELVLKTVKPVGYYAYAGDKSVYAFVLGEPHTLQHIQPGIETTKVLASDIGRGLASLPDGGISYVKMEKDQPWLHRIDPAGTQDRRLMPLLPKTEGDYAWLPDGKTVLSAREGKVYLRTLGDETWQSMADLSEQGLSQITRLAVSTDGRWLVLVAERHSR